MGFRLKEKRLRDGFIWKTLSHNGPVLPPKYKRVPKHVKFYYNRNHVKLSRKTEEVAGLYARMLKDRRASKALFKRNFFRDWREVMTPREREIIRDFKKCNFRDFHLYYKEKEEERKTMTKQEKLEMKKENEKLTKKYGYCMLDGQKQEVDNFQIESPGLFKGRGFHAKMGMLKRRVEAEDVVINIGKRVKVPKPPPGHRWKEVRHDNQVAWLAKWNVLDTTKYLMLSASCKLKDEENKVKYEKARKLKTRINGIRKKYRQGFQSRNMRVRQRAVALYFIDKLCLRIGNENDKDTTDIVGCCSLQVKHITLDKKKDDKKWVVSFDFSGKNFARNLNSMPVDKRVFKNLKLFMKNKQPGDSLFDRLNTSMLTKHLNDLMEGLTAKVFRTYNASKTLEKQLDILTKNNMVLHEKVLAYHKASKEVAIMCYHQKAAAVGFSKSMANLESKISAKIYQIKRLKKEFADSKKITKREQKIHKKRFAQLEEQLKKLKQQATDQETNKRIALETSKLNYLDPRVTIAQYGEPKIKPAKMRLNQDDSFQNPNKRHTIRFEISFRLPIQNKFDNIPEDTANKDEPIPVISKIQPIMLAMTANHNIVL
ncbi:DNA topoisomerase 1 [Caerostris darwini]|uniref:DNA topoisomerase 1 n=1 Tax=Caerostris darwini TaxID=1538125 RepID=A0AAV4TNS7_9ARAC|nr:DNA topoisomerase 1 [Caerostris darwini]